VLWDRVGVRVSDGFRVSTFYFSSHQQPAESRIPAGPHFTHSLIGKTIQAAIISGYPLNQSITTMLRYYRVHHIRQECHLTFGFIRLNITFSPSSADFVRFTVASVVNLVRPSQVHLAERSALVGTRTLAATHAERRAVPLRQLRVVPSRPGLIRTRCMDACVASINKLTRV